MITCDYSLLGDKWENWSPRVTVNSRNYPFLIPVGDLITLSYRATIVVLNAYVTYGYISNRKPPAGEQRSSLERAGAQAQSVRGRGARARAGLRPCPSTSSSSRLL